MEKEKQENIFEKAGIRFHRSLSFKLFIIGILLIVLLIPKIMILELIKERNSNSNKVIQEVMDKWSNPQTISGPILFVPYIRKIFDEEEKKYNEKLLYATFLPDDLKITGEIIPKKLNRSIYEVFVYESFINFSGIFNPADLEEMNITKDNIIWENAQLQFGINDLRGISKNPVLNWNKKAYTFEPGMKPSSIGNSGVSIPLELMQQDYLKGEFNISISLKGSQSLMFTPLGQNTEVQITSSWNDPGFIGNFLPDDRKVNEKGFSAQWNILHFNRNFPQKWVDILPSRHHANISNSAFGVELVSINGHYQKNTRSAKYSVLIILIIFLVFFLHEVFSKSRIHPFQYILVGSAITLFYLILLSFSEHIGFNFSYMLAASAIVVLVFLYSRSFMPRLKNSIGISLSLIGCFGFVFVLLHLETFALLAGSIGLFVLLAILMYATRKVNWYKE